MRSPILFLAALGLCACKKSDSSTDRSGSEDFFETFGSIESILDQMGLCQDAGSEICSQSEYTFSFVPLPEARESIMVIDQIGLWSMIGKYYRRTQAFEVNEAGQPVPLTRSMPLSNGMHQILDALHNWESPGNFMEGKENRERGTKIFARLSQNPVTNSDLQTIGVFGHGSSIFGYLADSNPDVNLIAVTGLLFPAPVLCAWRDGTVAAYARDLAANLASLANANQVSYINASFGFSYSLAQSRLGKECQDKPAEADIIRIVSEQHLFFSELARLSHAQVIQAANESVEDWRIEREPSDCDNSIHTKRKRVGYYFGEGPGYAAETAAFPDKPASQYPGTLKERSACVDLFIDSGFTAYLVPSQEPFDLTLDGLISNQGFLMATSYAAPIALSFLRSEANKRTVTAHQAFLEVTSQSADKFIHWGRQDRP